MENLDIADIASLYLRKLPYTKFLFAYKYIICLICIYYLNGSSNIYYIISDMFVFDHAWYYKVIYVYKEINRGLHFLCFVSSSEDEANMRVSDKDISVFPEWCLSTQCLHSCENEVKLHGVLQSLQLLYNLKAKVGFRWCDFVYKSNIFIVCFDYR